jgi:hypothetical protein
MTGIPATSDDNQPREWSISNRTLRPDGTREPGRTVA